MKYSMTTSALIGAVSAIVVPRQACLPLKHSVAPAPVPNTAEAFATYPYWGDLATVIVSPSGFESVFTNASAAVRSSGYMNYVELDTYDVSACAQQCDAARRCEAFNIYFQRNPSVEPAAGCPNPTANTLVVCGLYSAPLSATEIVNEGQNRGPVDSNGQAFEVVIRGSNVYNRVAQPSSPSTTDTVTVYTSEPKETITVWFERPCTETVTIATTATLRPDDTPPMPFLTPGPFSFPPFPSTTALTSTPLSLIQPSQAIKTPSADSTRSILWITSIKTVYPPAPTSYDPAMQVIYASTTYTSTTTKWVDVPVSTTTPPPSRQE